MLLEGLEGIDPIAGELLVGERDRTSHGLAGVGILLGVLALAVLDVDDLVLCPGLLELTENTAVVAGIAVAIVLALPRDDGRQVRRVHGGNAPLVAGVVGNAEHADLAVAPRLRAGPFDALVEVLNLARRIAVHHAGRPAGAARIDADNHIAVRYPTLGIGNLPVLVLVGRTLQYLRMICDHLFPLLRIAFLVGQPLGIDTIGKDDRVAAVRDRLEDVGAQHKTVARLDALVPCDFHAVPYLGTGFDIRILSHCLSSSAPQGRGDFLFAQAIRRVRTELRRRSDDEFDQMPKTNPAAVSQIIS